MSNEILLDGQVGIEITLLSVKEKVENSDKSKPLNISINSPGGYVYEGEAIYNYLKGLDQEVNTHAVGLVASMASIFYLAGKKRTAYRNSNNIFIHLPLGGSEGNAKDLEKDAKELRRLEDKLSNIYALETSLTKDEALELMGKDEMVETNFLLEKGIVTDILEFKAVATIKNNNMSKQDLTEKDKTWLQGLFDKFKTDEQPTNKIVQDANGNDVDFTDLEDEATPKVGDKATIDGASAEGDVKMPSGETFKFEAGELIEIMPAESDDDNDEPTEAEALQAKIDELTAEAVLKDEEIANAKQETVDATAKFTNVTEKFSELENTIKSKFDYNGKLIQPKQENRNLLV